MPFIIPAVTPGMEGLNLAGLDLAQGPNGVIQLDAFTPPIPKKKYEWIEASDSDGAILARDPLVSNGQATVKVGIAAVTRDDANTAIGQIVDMLEEADRNPGGIPLVWTPSDSTPTLTFYVLSGEVTDMPVDWESGYMAYQPSVTFTLDCRPYGYMDDITISGVATAGPLVTLDLPDVPGDVPAEGRLVITEASSQSRRTVEWGAEYLHYDPSSPWSLVLDSDSLVTSGFAGTQTTLAGAYDPGAAGNSIITSTLASAAQAICGTGAQPHIGTFRVKARVNSGPAGGSAYFRFAWRVGDGTYTTNDPVLVKTFPTQAFLELDLGLITIPEALTGTQSWDGRIEGWSATSAAETMYVDYLMLIPVEAGYGKATASYAYTPGVIVARDSFAGLGSGSALSARTPDAGAAWVTAGVATDFVGSTTTETTTTQPRVTRSTSIAEASARVGVLGGAMTDQRVSATIYTTSGYSGISMGVVARYVDISNYLWLRLRYVGAGSAYLELVKKIAGVDTTIASKLFPAIGIGARLSSFSLTVFATGHAIGTTTGSEAGVIDTTDTALATAGTLASGKAGIADQSVAGLGSVPARKFDDIVVETPVTEPIAMYSGQSLEVRHDDTLRESSAGGTWGRPPSYRGSRFKVNPAGAEDRTTRVAAKASRNDLTNAADDNLTDQILIEAIITPRCSVVPRP